VSGDERGLRVGHFGLQNAQRGDAAYEQRGLCVERIVEFVFRPFKAEPREGKAEHFVGFLKSLARNGVSVGKVLAHADHLRALTGKNKGRLRKIGHHEFFSMRMLRRKR
jgi:hypothetical protein